MAPEIGHEVGLGSLGSCTARCSARSIELSQREGASGLLSAVFWIFKEADYFSMLQRFTSFVAVLDGARPPGPDGLGRQSGALLTQSNYWFAVSADVGRHLFRPPCRNLSCYSLFPRHLPSGLNAEDPS